MTSRQGWKESFLLSPLVLGHAPSLRGDPALVPVRHRWSRQRHEHTRWQELQAVVPGDFLPVHPRAEPSWAEVVRVEQTLGGARVTVRVDDPGGAAGIRSWIPTARGYERVYHVDSVELGYVADRPLSVPARRDALRRLAGFDASVVPAEAWWPFDDTVGWLDGPPVSHVFAGPEWVFTPTMRFLTVSTTVSLWLDRMDECPTGKRPPPNDEVLLPVERADDERRLVDLAVGLAGDAIVPDPFPRIPVDLVWQRLGATVRFDRAALRGILG